MTDAGSLPTRRYRLIGRTYMEAGEPVTIVQQWRQPRQYEDTVYAPCWGCNIPHELPPGCLAFWHSCKAPMAYTPRPRGKSPRNVLIRRGDGTLVVRPFRGLRKTDPTTGGPQHG